jgi:GntR family transcriptional repressor for pyruvate dehydrogenase complex
MSIAPRENLQSYLRSEIVSGRMPAGEKLPSERLLAEQFGLSRPIVREILYGLRDGGLVDIQPSRGTFVRAASTIDGVKSLDTLYRRREATVRELTDARLMLETHAARLAALHATGMEIKTLRWTLDQLNEARHVLEEAQLDLAFHALIVRASHNMVIEITYASITSLTFELMLRSLSDRRIKQMGTPYHHKIWQAIADHDPDAAAAAMGEHIELARHLYGEDFDRSVNYLARRELHRQLGSTVSLETILQEVERRHHEHMETEFTLQRSRARSAGMRDAEDTVARPEPLKTKGE